MSETLTDAAPAVAGEAPPVGSGAPSTANSEVDAGSGSTGFDPAEWVEKDRFNGLMSALSKKDNELKQMQARMTEMETRLNEKPPTQEQESLADTSALEQQVAELTAVIQRQRLEGAKAEALSRHPEAAPFADLIVANTPEDFEEMAAAIAERARGLTPAEAEKVAEQVAETPPAEAPAEAPAPEAPVAGGGAAYVATEATQDRVRQAIEGKSWKDYLSAKWDQQVEENPDLQLETS